MLKEGEALPESCYWCLVKSNNCYKLKSQRQYFFQLYFYGSWHLCSFSFLCASFSLSADDRKQCHSSCLCQLTEGQCSYLASLKTSIHVP